MRLRDIIYQHPIPPPPPQKQIKMERTSMKKIEIDLNKYELFTNVNGKAVYRLKEKKLPSTWEERKKEEIATYYYTYFVDETIEKQIVSHRFAQQLKWYEFKTLKEAEELEAFGKLLKLRDEYNDGHVFDYSKHNKELKWCISCFNDELGKCQQYYKSKVMRFKSEELCDLFMHNFKKLLTTAKGAI
jgi:hypothetical protein